MKSDTIKTIVEFGKMRMQYDEQGRRIADSFKNKYSFSYKGKPSTWGNDYKKGRFDYRFLNDYKPPPRSLNMTTHDYGDYK